MKTEPAELSRDLVRTALAERWRIRADVVEYLPVGGGGHHWRASADNSQEWFVTANGLVDRGHWLEPDADSLYARTQTAYETVRDLGLPFAVTAIPDRTGSLLHRIHPVWALSVYPYLHSVETVAGRSAQVVAGFIGQLHAYAVPPAVARWRTELPQRAHLMRALAEPDQPWSTGPYGEPTRKLIAAHQGVVADLLNHYDQLAAAIAYDSESWVLTHGEPHDGNTLHTADGTTLLIDWDTLAIAPRERDLWQLIDEPSGPVWESYQDASGQDHEPKPERMQLFPLWWRLTEIGYFIRRFRRSHSGDIADDNAWHELESLVG